MNKTITIVIATALLVAASLIKIDTAKKNSIPAPVHAAFAKWAMKYGKSYGTPSERNYRLKVFYKNLLRITREKLTAKTYTVGLNQFSDLTKKEFLTKHTGYRFRLRPRNEKPITGLQQAAGVDWRTKGAVTPMKNQGSCGSCWAFSAVASTEAAHAIKTGKLVAQSEQQLVDCSGSYGNHGCNGGWMDYAFKYIMDHGITTEAAYSYTGRQGSCHATGKPVVTKLSGFVDVPHNSDQQLGNAVSKTVVSVAIDAYGIMSYKSGIFKGNCGTSLNHGVAAVGFGEEGGLKYWIVRNSWGTHWGEEGYLRIVRQDGAGKCGINMAASYATV